MPLIGRLSGHGEAYRYLVAGVRAYPSPEHVAGLMRRAGLVDVGWSSLTLGLVTIHVGTRPAAG